MNSLLLILPDPRVVHAENFAQCSRWIQEHFPKSLPKVSMDDAELAVTIRNLDCSRELKALSQPGQHNRYVIREKDARLWVLIAFHGYPEARDNGYVGFTIRWRTFMGHPDGAEHLLNLIHDFLNLNGVSLSTQDVAKEIMKLFSEEGFGE